MKQNNAVVLLSGGQDSMTCLFWALRNFDGVHAISFDYGQKHKIELEQARKICEKMKVPFHLFDVKGIFLNSALVNHDENINGAHHRNKDLPASFTAGRNAVFLTIAGGYAYDNNINNIVTGVCQTDYSGYPDCRQRFVDAAQLTVSLAVDCDMFIHTPLMYLTKMETWKLAADLCCLEEVVENSHTCYNGDHSTKNEWGYGCGECPACLLRKRGYEEFKKL